MVSKAQPDDAGGKEPRGQWNSRIGYILAMVGSAVGLGNIVRFPFVTSSNGGGVFVLIYLIAVLLIGIPMVLAELTLGRRSKRNVVDTFRNLGNRRWALLGLFFIFFNVYIMAWYSVIGGWTLIYLLDGFSNAYFADPTSFFSAVTEGPRALLFHAIFISIAIGIVAGGVSEGIEPAVIILMPLLILVMVGLAIYGITLDGAGEGLSFYLQPDLSDVSGGTIVAAVGQAFFSMSIGFGALLTYASYMSRDSDLNEDGVTVGLSDTGVALLAGFVMFPLLGVIGILGTAAVAEGGIGVAFLSLPVAFGTIGGTLGTGVAVGFFFLLFAAALSSAISLLEVGVGWLTDRGYARWKSALVLGLLMYCLGIAMAFSSPILDLAAGALTDVFVIFGALIIAVFLGWYYERYLDEDPGEEMDRGAGSIRLGRASYFMIKWIIPAVLVVLLSLAVLNVAGVEVMSGA